MPDSQHFESFNDESTAAPILTRDTGPVFESHDEQPLDDDFYRLETVDQGVYDVLYRSEGYLQEVFHYYALLSLPHDRIGFNDFRRFVRDFRLLTLVSMQEVSDSVKSTIGTEDIAPLQMQYPEFILSLEALAMIGYARHP